jgi:hypothetical protein
VDSKSIIIFIGNSNDIGFVVYKSELDIFSKQVLASAELLKNKSYDRFLMVVQTVRNGLYEPASLNPRS